MSENVTAQMFGRTVITSPVIEVNANNVKTILDSAVLEHTKNQKEIIYLHNYIKGDQPILYKEKIVRPEINNKKVENHALEIVEFKTGYVFSEPIQYVKHGEKKAEESKESENDEITAKITRLNDYMTLAGKSKIDYSIGYWQNICGTAYRMALPNKKYDEKDPDSCPFEIDSLDPRYTFVVYSSGFGSKPLMGVKFIKNSEGNVVYSVFTETKYYEITGNEVKEESHTYQFIPIIEYPANDQRLGAFEVVLGLLDSLNNTISSRLDGVEQFVQAFMKLINCEIDDAGMKKVRELGAVIVKQIDPQFQVNVDMISSELDQQQTQTLKDDIYQMVLIICGMPDRNGSNRTTGDTGKAVILRDGWGAAEARAKSTEIMFGDAERRFLRLVLRYLRDLTDLNLNLSSVDIKFTRNRTDNLIVKTQGLQNMLEAGIHPRIALNTCELFSDPEQVYSDSLQYLKKWLEAKASYTPGNNKGPENTEVN